MHFIDKTLIKNSVILAVDDSPVLLDALDISLSDHCKEFIMTVNAEEAIDIVVKKAPDLVLLDIEMPKMSGFELFERLKELTIIARIPVIFLTSTSDKKTEARALELGAVDYITKPFDCTVLMHRINVHLNISYHCSNLENALLSIENSLVNTFSELLESRDKYAVGHAKRTALYLEILGNKMIESQEFNYELTESLLQKMVRAVPLHDIGKVVVPDRTLLKSGVFDEEDFEIMKSHTVKGAAILDGLYKKMPSQYYLVFAVQMALSHHERFDGSGYPDGLKENDIPLSARMMAIADVYDALTAKRPYRKAMTHEQAVDIIIHGKGSLFDPKIVDIFEKTQEQFKKIKKDEN
jgi:putative two-component system response regulator